MHDDADAAPAVGDTEGAMRLDALAAEAGVPTSTIRLYRQRGLLPPPRLVGRTGWYGRSHLARLRLIAELQEQGFSLAGIGRLLDSWEQGRDLTDLVGVEEQLDEVLNRTPGAVIDADELASHFPADALTPDLVRRAVELGLVEPADDGRLRIPDRRFLDIGSDLARLGVPLDVVLDEWERLRRDTDEIARRFVAVFEDHLLPTDWERQLDAAGARELAGTLARLQHQAGAVLLSALDASMATVTAERVGALVERDRPSA